MEFSSLLVWSWILIKRTEEFQQVFFNYKEIVFTSVCFANPYFASCTILITARSPRAKETGRDPVSYCTNEI